MRLRWTTPALNELDELIEIIQADNELAAIRALQQVRIVEANMLMFPKAARYNRSDNFFERPVPRTRILLIYQIRETEIVIVATFHTSRNPKTKPK